MTWISLALVALIFYSPLTSVASDIASKNISVSLKLPLLSALITIPFTGPLRLFLISFGVWFFVWQAVIYLEKAIGQDFLKRMRLRNDLVYADKPKYINKFTVRIAQIWLGLLLLKTILSTLIQIALEKLVPWLLTQILPETISSLIPHFESFLTQLLSFVNRYDFDDTLVLLCILILIADKAFIKEQMDRNRLDLLHQRKVRKSKPREIEIPTTQD